jgi:exo-beta-1,3-glucanase (GH17 family)
MSTDLRLSRRNAMIASGATAAAVSFGLQQNVAGQATPAASTQPDVLTFLQTSRAWINYIPTAPFDFQIGQEPVTEDHLRADLEFLYNVGFRGLVTNAVTYGLEAAPRVAKEVGFEYVIAKLWWPDEETLEIEKANLAQEIAHVDAIVIGNEPIHKAYLRGVPPDDALARLKLEIAMMQSLYGLPVTTGLHREEWMLYPELATEVGDFTFANLQPWWALIRNDGELAAKWVIDVHTLMTTTPGMPADRVVVPQEACYPSSTVEPDRYPGATEAEQLRFYELLIESGIPFVYGFSFDQAFAEASSLPGGFGGLWHGDATPKPAVDVLDLGTYK